MVPKLHFRIPNLPFGAPISVLCGYVPPISWASDAMNGLNIHTDNSSEAITCETCAAMLKGLKKNQ